MLKKNEKKEPKLNLVTLQNQKSFQAEEYRKIRTNIQFSSFNKEIRTIVVTSANQSEGKTTIAINLAIVSAQQGNKVLLVDTNLRKPVIHTSLGLNNETGLTNVLIKKINIMDAVQATEIENLAVLTSGRIPPNPAELVGSHSMTSLIMQCKREFDLIIFDTPPLLAVTDAQIMANKCDGTILVISSGSTDIEKAMKAKGILQSAAGSLLGVVLNNKK